MFARFATLFALSLVAFNAQAAHLDKLFDGTAAYCPPVESIKPIAPQTAVVAKLQGRDTTGTRKRPVRLKQASLSIQPSGMKW